MAYWNGIRMPVNQYANSWRATSYMPCENPFGGWQCATKNSITRRARSIHSGTPWRCPCSMLV